MFCFDYLYFCEKLITWYKIIMLKKLYQGSVVAFIIFWIVFIFLDYWQKHPMYYYNFKFFQYTFLTIIWALIGGGLIWAIDGKINKKRKFPIPVNGLSLFITGLIISLINIQFFLGIINQNLLNIVELATVSGKVIYTAFATFSTTLVCYVLGSFINKLFDLPLTKGEQTIINIAAGIMGLVGICFVLGIFKGLYWFTLLPVFLIIAGLGWRKSWYFIKSCLWISILPKKKMNLIGYISFYILILLVSINFISIIIPFPRGWDSLALYVNLPSLINDHAGLVPGNQPYNWSIFMSIGFILFKSISTTLSLSSIGAFLSVLALYHLGKNWLKIDINHTILGITMFYALPTIGHQIIMEQKVDLGLLFMLLCIIILLMNWVKVYFDPDPLKKSKKQATESILSLQQLPDRWLDPHMILIGLLTGFSLGIKLTTLFTFFGVLACIWYLLKGQLGFLAMFSLSFFGMLLVRMDEMSGLRVYHQSASIVMWIMLLIGIALLAYIFLKDKYSFMKGLRLSIIYGLFLTLPFIPWLVKNFTESGGKISVTSLLNGKSTAPKGSVKHFTRNWERANKNK